MSLTTSQQQVLTAFQEITQLNDSDLCASILQRNQWNLQSAVDNYVNGTYNTASSNSSTSTTSANTSSLNPNDLNVNQELSNQQSYWFLSALWNPMKFVFQVRPSMINPEQDTRLFVNDFNQEYGFTHPTFHMSSYQNAVQNAFQNHKYLLIYIHSPLHEDTQTFCQSTLCTEGITRYIDDNMIFWSGRVWDTEAYSLSIQLKATSYPFLALLVCQSERVVQVVNRLEGSLTEEELLEQLTNNVAQSSSVINRIRAETTRRQETVSLREQQDREYKEAEDTDRRERERKLKEKQEKEKKEHDEQQAIELKEAVELSERLSYESLVHRKKGSIKPEPTDGPDVATIRFQLPKSSKITRKFHRHDTIEQVSDFLIVHFFDTGSNIKNFSLSTHFPKQELTDMSVTVESVGLHPRGMLYVNDLDA